MINWFGNDKIAFFKVDGNLVNAIARRFQIPYYPYIIYIKPNTNGREGDEFTKSPRNYDTIKRWLFELMENEAPLPGVVVPGFRDDL